MVYMPFKIFTCLKGLGDNTYRPEARFRLDRDAIIVPLISKTLGKINASSTMVTEAAAPFALWAGWPSDFKLPGAPYFDNCFCIFRDIWQQLVTAKIVRRRYFYSSKFLNTKLYNLYDHKLCTKHSIFPRCCWQHSAIAMLPIRDLFPENRVMGFMGSGCGDRAGIAITMSRIFWSRFGLFLVLFTLIFGLITKKS